MAIDNLTFAMHVEEQRKKLIEKLKNKGVEIASNVSLNKAVNSVDYIETIENNVSNKEFLIRYYDIDGTILKDEYVNANDELTPPEAPSYDSEYIKFVEWYGLPDVIDQDTAVLARYEVKKENTSIFIFDITETSQQIVFNVTGTGLTINWGDGNIETDVLTHTYQEAGEYVVEITGSFSLTKYNGLISTGKKFLKKCYLKNDIQLNQESAFREATKLEILILPELNMTKVPKYVVYQNHCLKTIIYRGSFTSFNSNELYECTSLKCIKIHDNCQNLSELSMSGHPLIEIFNFPKNMVSAGGVYLSLVKKLKFPDSTTSVSSINCPKATEIYIPCSVKTKDCFKGCSNLKKLIIKGGLEILGSTFSGCNELEELPIITKMTISSVNTSSGPNYISSVFMDCYKLKKITLTDDAKYTGYMMFARCHSLESLTLGESVSGFGQYSFDMCYSLRELIVKCLQVPRAFSIDYLPKYLDVIWVNDDIIEDLKVATNWAKYADIMKPLSEKPIE